jgi:acyl carrier protein
MELNDFVEKMVDCFNQTEASEITPSTRFRELEEWGSMMALIVIAMIDSDFNKTVDADDLKAANTIQELFTIVQNKPTN